MAEECKFRRISGDTASALHHMRRAPLDRLRKLDSAIESMDPSGKGVAGILIVEFRKPRQASRDTPCESFPLQAGKRLPNIGSERRVERAIVEGRLHQPDFGRSLAW